MRGIELRKIMDPNMLYIPKCRKGELNQTRKKK